MPWPKDLKLGRGVGIEQKKSNFLSVIELLLEWCVCGGGGTILTIFSCFFLKRDTVKCMVD